METWNKDRTLPDGTKGVASNKSVELVEGVTIEAGDEFEEDRCLWIRTFRHAPSKMGTKNRRDTDR
jgi:hypothetical protein